MSQGVTRASLNLQYPDEPAFNDFLRNNPSQHEDGTFCPEDAKSAANPSGTISPLAGSLFGGYATIRNQD